MFQILFRLDKYHIIRTFKTSLEKLASSEIFGVYFSSLMKLCDQADRFETVYTVFGYLSVLSFCEFDCCHTDEAKKELSTFVEGKDIEDLFEIDLKLVDENWHQDMIIEFKSGHTCKANHNKNAYFSLEIEELLLHFSSTVLFWSSVMPNLIKSKNPTVRNKRMKNTASSSKIENLQGIMKNNICGGEKLEIDVFCSKINTYVLGLLAGNTLTNKVPVINQSEILYDESSDSVGRLHFKTSVSLAIE